MEIYVTCPIIVVPPIFELAYYLPTPLLSYLSRLSIRLGVSPEKTRMPYKKIKLSYV